MFLNKDLFFLHFKSKVHLERGHANLTWHPALLTYIHLQTEEEASQFPKAGRVLITPSADKNPTPGCKTFAFSCVWWFENYLYG